MLAPASQYQTQLSKLWAEKATDPDYLYWHVDIHYNPLADIRNTNYRKDEWVSVVDGEVVGYFCVLVDKNTRSANDMSIASFKKSKQYGYDFVTFIKTLERKYRYVRWAAVDGHPHEKHYLSILKRYNGRVVGVFKNKIKLLNGRLYDEKWYEINNENHASRLKETKR